MSQLPTHDFAIPVFAIETASAKEMLASIGRIRQQQAYDMEDIKNVSDWIGLCAFQYLLDHRWDYFLDEKKEQDAGFYHHKCHHLSKVTASILNKLNVKQSICFTGTATQQQISHVAILARYAIQGEEIAILYDHSLRQYFRTDKNGLLLEDQETYKTSSIMYQHLLKDKQSLEMTCELLQTGSTDVDHDKLEAYIQNFVTAAQRQSDYDHALDVSGEYLYRNTADKEDFLYNKWSIIPQTVQGIRQLQNHQMLKRLGL